MRDTTWSNARIAILGYGVEGQSSVDYFLRHGAKVDVHDQKALATLPSHKVKGHLEQGVEFFTEDQAFGDLVSYDLLMRTPTFSPYHPSLSQVDPDKISSQAKLFLTQWRNQTIGISGTKGKGTVATLIHHLLIKSGKKTVLGGNIGVPLLEIIDDMDEETVAVAELSSFQLWDITVSPHLAVLLMVTPEHLDQHVTLENYLQSKQNLLRFQNESDLAVVLQDYPLSAQLAEGMPASQWHVSRNKVSQGAVAAKDGIYLTSQPGKTVAALHDTVLRGEHNADNLAAALLAIDLLGVDLVPVPFWLQDYKPLPHRLEKVGSYRQIDFYDDSIATTPEAAIAGIQSFSEPLVVILGGINRQTTWSELAKCLNRPNIKAVALVGEEAPRIKQALDERGIMLPTLFQPEDYDDVITWSMKILDDQASGVLLLSPGAKSFDQYQDYRDRGEKFAAAVQRYIQK